MSEEKGIIFDIQRWSIHDGPGIRTNVFFKGCPLTCVWCSNPESQFGRQELAYFKDKCIDCGRCIKNCKYGAIKPSPQGNQIDYSVCRSYCYDLDDRSQDKFPCVSKCYAQALTIMGEYKSSEEIMKEVLSDKGIYDESGGGITLTGGEPYAQPEFMMELLKCSKKNKIHTVVETCGYAPWKKIEPTLPFVDFMFIDCKLFQITKHKTYTGVDNTLILENMKRINNYSKTHDLQLVIRMPLIPGINDTEEEILDIIRFIKEELNQVNVFQLLPYHRLGRGKYGNIGKDYKMVDTMPPETKEVRILEELIKSQGLLTTYE